MSKSKEILEKISKIEEGNAESLKKTMMDSMNNLKMVAKQSQIKPSEMKKIEAGMKMIKDALMSDSSIFSE